MLEDWEEVDLERIWITTGRSRATEGVEPKLMLD